MQNKLAQRTKPTNFKIVEGSNYEVIMSFDHKEIVNYEHFKALANAIFKTNSTFVTVNDCIVQTKDIRIIKPTNRPTNTQLKENKEAEILREAEYKKQIEEESRFQKHAVKWMNKRFPKGWSIGDKLKNLDKITRDFQS